MSNPRVQPDPTRLMWVELGWVEFFLTHHDGLSKKISSTRHYPTHKHLSNESFFLKRKKKKKDKIRNAVLFKGKKKRFNVTRTRGGDLFELSPTYLMGKPTEIS